MSLSAESNRHAAIEASVLLVIKVLRVNYRLLSTINY